MGTGLNRHNLISFVGVAVSHFPFAFSPSLYQGWICLRDPNLLGSDALFCNSIKDTVRRTRLPFNPTPSQKFFNDACAIR
jgi:hypothetical protein